MKKVNRICLMILAAAMITGTTAACSVQLPFGDKTETTAQPSTVPVTTVAPTTVAPTTEPISGFVEENGIKKFYSNGELKTNTIVGSDEEGYFYAGEDGTINPGYCDGVVVNDKEWVVIEGSAYSVETDSDECLFKAAKDVAKCTNTDMTREEKLKACFDYIKSNYLEGVRHDPPYPYTEPDWPVVYANDIFVYGKGDCYSYGAAYAYMGKAIGYTEVYACNSGGHGWAEIEGKYYDPEWDIHHNEYNHFGVLPDDPCDVNYSGTLVMGKAWMRIKI